MSRQSIFKKLLRPRLMITPVFFLHVAILGAAAFGVCHLLGFRQYTSIITTGGLCDEGAALKACAYLGSYVALVVLVPILLLASAFFAALQRAVMRSKSESHSHKES